MITFLVLDYRKPVETRQCLESIARHAKFDYTVTLLVNGGDLSYASSLVEEGLVDQLILNKENTGLGIGTTDLFRSCKTEFAFYLQNDQFLRCDISEKSLDQMLKLIGQTNGSETIASISLAGAPCGKNIYSERAHIIRTDFYNNVLPTDKYGAGPYHNGPWNEELIQKFYAENNCIHLTGTPLVQDNGHAAIRENPDGSVWRHQPDTKKLWLVDGEVHEKHIYPKFTEEEWDTVIETNEWPDGQIPENEKADSFEAFNKL